MTEEEISKPQTPETNESAESSSTSSESVEATDSGQGQADPQGTSGEEAVTEKVKSNESTSAEPAQTKPEASSDEPGEALDQQEIVDLPDFSGMLAEAADSSIELLRDVELNVKIELGRSEMTIEQILKLGNGSVVELDKLAGDPVDILVNEQLIARGEVLVLNENFCVRINEIIPGLSERIAQE